MRKSYTVQIIREAQEDINESKIWYNEQKKNLGNEFFQAVEACIELIRSDPERFPVVHNRNRKLRVFRFPFNILYWFKKNSSEIFIIGVIHTKRNPRLYKTRKH